jgi:hypothetical protein
MLLWMVLENMAGKISIEQGHVRQKQRQLRWMALRSAPISGLRRFELLRFDRDDLPRRLAGAQDDRCRHPPVREERKTADLLLDGLDNV